MRPFLVSNKTFTFQCTVHYHSDTHIPSWTGLFSAEESGPELPRPRRRLSAGWLLSISQGILVYCVFFSAITTAFYFVLLFENFCHFKPLGFVCGLLVLWIDGLCIHLYAIILQSQIHICCLDSLMVCYSNKHNSFLYPHWLFRHSHWS